MRAGRYVGLFIAYLFMLAIIVALPMIDKLDMEGPAPSRWLPTEKR